MGVVKKLKEAYLRKILWHFMSRMNFKFNSLKNMLMLHLQEMIATYNLKKKKIQKGFKLTVGSHFTKITKLKHKLEVF